MEMKEGDEKCDRKSKGSQSSSYHRYSSPSDVKGRMWHVPAAPGRNPVLARQCAPVRGDRRPAVGGIPRQRSPLSRAVPLRHSLRRAVLAAGYARSVDRNLRRHGRAFARRSFGACEAHACDGSIFGRHISVLRWRDRLFWLRSRAPHRAPSCNRRRRGAHSGDGDWHLRLGGGGRPPRAPFVARGAGAGSGNGSQVERARRALPHDPHREAALAVPDPIAGDLQYDARSVRACFPPHTRLHSRRGLLPGEPGAALRGKCDRGPMACIPSAARDPPT
jgi:hypothetical protein